MPSLIEYYTLIDSYPPEWGPLAVCRPMRNELLPIIYNKKSVELRTSPFYNGESPWAMNFLQDLGSNAKFLASIKIVQIIYGSRTLQNIRPWAHSLNALYGTLQSCLDVQFESEDPGPLSYLSISPSGMIKPASITSKRNFRTRQGLSWCSDQLDPCMDRNGL